LRIRWSDGVRKVLAAVLYVVGVAAVLFIAYRDYAVPNSILGYWPLFVVGMALVVAAALLWPISNPDAADSDDEGKAA
jgi:hypothetical protein